MKIVRIVIMITMIIRRNKVKFLEIKTVQNRSQDYIEVATIEMIMRTIIAKRYMIVIMIKYQ